MGQDLLLKSDVATNPATVTSKSKDANSVESKNDAESRPFSSTLDEQIDKQETAQIDTKKKLQEANKEAITSDSKPKASQSAKGKEDESDADSGNIVLTDEAKAVRIDVNGLIAESPQAITSETDIIPVITKDVLAGKGFKDIGDEHKTAILKDQSVDTEPDIITVATKVTLAAKDEKDMRGENIISVTSTPNNPAANIEQDIIVDNAKKTILPVVALTDAALNSVVKQSGKGEKAESSTLSTSKKLMSDKKVNAQAQFSAETEVQAQEKNVGKELKHGSPIVRSDILNALNKNKGNVTAHVDSTRQGDAPIMKTEKTLMAQMISGDKVSAEMRQAVDNVGKRQLRSLLSKSQARQFEPHGLGTLATSATANTAIQAASSSQPVLALQPSIQSEAWAKVLSSRVVWMAREGVQQAELRLNPANLGPVEVKLHMNNEQANISFVAHNAATREALEQALPKLRESFQENGMDLAHADVSEQASEQQDEEKDSSSQTLNEQQSENDTLEQQDKNELIESNELELGVSVFA